MLDGSCSMTANLNGVLVRSRRVTIRPLSCLLRVKSGAAALCITAESTLIEIRSLNYLDYANRMVVLGLPLVMTVCAMPRIDPSRRKLDGP